MRRCLSVWIAMMIMLADSIAFAANESPEAEMAAALFEAVQLLGNMHKDGITLVRFDRLKALEEKMRPLHLLLEDKFERRERRAAALSSVASRRHEAMHRTYRHVVEFFLDELEELQLSGQLSQARIEHLLNLLEPGARTQDMPIYGNLPYRNLGIPARKPDTENTVSPAYLSETPQGVEQDLEADRFAPKARAIVELAESLNWSPVEIYGWVKNNVATQWYWGVMKGAEDTLRQKSGNDCDQAALLVALLRAANYPARYVRGIISLYPDLSAARKYFGIREDEELLQLLQKAGIPHEVQFSAGRIEQLHIEHIWVETQVPYANYRGAVLDDSGKIWIPLDTSFKPAGYTIAPADAVASRLELGPLRDLYLAGEHRETPMEYLRTQVDRQLLTLEPGTDYNDLLAIRSQNPEHLKILPPSLQFKTIQITGEYTELPEALVHYVVFRARSTDGHIFYDQRLSAAHLSNQAVLLTFEPHTVDDQEIINAFGGLDNTPSYLIRLRPVIEVAGERKIIGTGGLAAGETFIQTIGLEGPTGQQQFDNTHITGSPAFIGIFAQKAVRPADMDLAAKTAAAMLHEAAAQYDNLWYEAEEELAALLRITIVRPMPGVVTTGGVMEISELLGQPHDLDWKGVFVDADLRAIETIGGLVMDDGAEARKLFMQLSALEGSYLEAQVLEETFQVGGVAAAQLLGHAADRQNTILRIDSANIDAVLPGLTLAGNVKEDIVDAVNQNLTVRIPAQLSTFEDWTGIGYIKENPETGEAGYMLSGRIAGGMTVWGLYRWPEDVLRKMTYSYTGEVNEDPAVAVRIDKIMATDMQAGTVGQPLAAPLQVLVRDAEGKPVSGAQVEFFIRAGGGRFENGATVLTAATDPIGVARAGFVCGTSTSVNPAFWWEKDKAYPQQAGENIISARLSSLKTELAVPFTAYGLPGAPASIQSTFLGGGSPLTIVFSILAEVLDSYGNPCANEKVVFSIGRVERYETCSKPSPETRQDYLVKRDDPCLAENPTYGQCSSGGTVIEDIADYLYGAVAYVMAGAVPGTNTEIVISCRDITSREWTHSTVFGNCNGYSPPAATFRLNTSAAVDSHGNVIDAAPTGSAIPMHADIFFVRENEDRDEETIHCSDGSSRTCQTIIGGREFFIDTEFDQAGVSFGGQSGSDLGGGRFSIQYVVAPGVNHVEIVGRGAVDGKKHDNSCSECRVEDYAIERSSSIDKVVYGVTVVPQTDIVEVAVNDSNQSTCDVPIRYDIQPGEYKAGSAYVFIYRAGAPIAVLPGETQGSGFGALSRGFQFDEGVEYTADVVLNPGGGAEIRSESIVLRPGAVTIERIEIIDHQTKGCLIPIGGSREVKAFAAPADRTITWSLLHREKGVAAGIRSLGDATARIEAGERSESGWVTVRAEDRQNPCVYKEVRIFVGCPACENGECDALPGNGFVTLSSIDVGISLGPGAGGQAAGHLFIRSGKPDERLATPAGLFLSSVGNETVARYGEDQSLRQVMAPEALADIRVVDANGYGIYFYRPEEIIGEQNGLYQIAAGAVPSCIWTVENPTSAGGPTQLKVVETRDGKAKEHLYTWDSEQASWNLSKANGAQRLARSEEKNGDLRTVTETIKDRYGNIASKTRTTYRTFEWGEEIVQTIVDPDGAALATTTEYYTDKAQTGSYGRIARRIDPDGSWYRIEYDDQGRPSVEITPYLDSPPDSPAEQACARYYDYTPLNSTDSDTAADRHTARTVAETIAGQVVAKTYHIYAQYADGERNHITERCASSGALPGDPTNQRTIETYYPSGTGLADAGRLKSIVHPDGRMDIYLYSSGLYSPAGDSPGVFTQGAGTDIQESVWHVTADQPDGIPFKSTRDVTIASRLGRSLLSAVDLVTPTGFSRLTWSTHVHDIDGRVTDTYTSGNTHTQASWDCCGKVSDTDAAGGTTLYVYDDLNRIVSATREGAAGILPAQADIKTLYTYDALGRSIKTTVTSGSLAQFSRNHYDRAGRLAENIDASGLVTTYTYSPDGLTSTITRPGGATEITTRHIDGKTRHLTGSAVTNRYYAYSVNADGCQVLEVRSGSADGILLERSVTDMLGRTIRIELPGRITENYYDEKGHLVRVSQSGQADTLYRYDPLGNQTRSGLDIDGDGRLDPASMDRINESDTSYTELSGQWWQQTTQKVFPVDNDPTAVTVSVQRTQVTGLIEDHEQSETVAVDIHGNATVSRTTCDPAAKAVTRTIDYPDSTIDAESISVNGRLIQSRSKSGIVTTFAYDGLGRRTGRTDPRTGTETTRYDVDHRIAEIEDSAGHRTLFTYDPESGRKIAQTDALGKTAYYAYNPRGQVTNTWGEVPYPASYQYDDSGRMIAMTTYRSEYGFDGAKFPEGAGGDTTTWGYDPAGLLTSKQYADGTRVDYAYTPEGKILTRTWARKHDGQPLVTTYGYDPATGELLHIDYSDDTPGVTLAYDRLGRTKEVMDAAGTHGFTYNTALQPLSESHSGLADAMLTRTYDGSGRAAGFTLDTDQSVAYGYDPAGRFNSLSWTIAGRSGSAGYRYLPDSDLLGGVTTGSGIATVYNYEEKRDLKTSVQNSADGLTLSRYDYVYDPIGRRLSDANSGTAFVHPAFDRYRYNDRSEVVASDRYLGDDVGDLSQPVTDRQRAYLYDPIGNRTRSEAARVQTLYTSNMLNQYESVAAAALAYDLDGNLAADHKGLAYIYDAENRLIAVAPQTPAEGGTRTEFVYDYMGRRVRKAIYGFASGSWEPVRETVYVYDGWNMIKATTIEEGQSSVDTNYLWGLDLSQSLQGAGGVGGLIAAVKGSSTYHYLFDANGNVGQVVDGSDGALVAHYEYDPFGDLVNKTGAFADENPYRFSTKCFDERTSLYYYGNRHYSPVLGRWINRDPVEEKSGPNIYSIVGNNTISKTDFIGLWGQEVHFEMTRQWARELFTDESADLIAEWNNGVDAISGGRSPIPFAGDQGYHFNRNRGGGKDTRIEYFEKHMKFARLFCSGRALEVFEQPEMAAKQLGIAIHPLQDWVAHGDYAYMDEGAVLTWHNKYSPQREFGNDPAAYPDDPTLDSVGELDGRPSGSAMHAIVINTFQYDAFPSISIRLYAIFTKGNLRITKTKSMIEDALLEFKEHVRKNGSCRCQQFFGAYNLNIQR